MSGMFTLVSTVPVAKSICDGTPTPIASGSPGRGDHVPYPVLDPVEQGVGADGDGRVLAACVAVTPSTAATATFVPPTSTPRTTLNS